MRTSQIVLRVNLIILLVMQLRYLEIRLMRILILHVLMVFMLQHIIMLTISTLVKLHYIVLLTPEMQLPYLTIIILPRSDVVNIKFLASLRENLHHQHIMKINHLLMIAANQMIMISVIIVTCTYAIVHVMVGQKKKKKKNLSTIFAVQPSNVTVN